MMTAAILATSRPANLLAFAAIGTALGFYWFYKGFRLLQRKRLILNTPASRIRSASMGLVEISGLAAGPYVLTSPFKQVECYYYQSTAWQLKQQGKNTQWVKVAEETLHVPFYIKVEERCIKPKNFVFMLGTLSQNPGLDASIRPACAERAGQKFTPPLNPSDKDKDTNKDAEADTAPVQQIIRLSSETDRLPAVAMTQQQKIAAALVRAGISNPAPWSAATKPQSAAALKTQPAATVQIQTRPVPERKTEVVRKAETEDPKGFDLHPPVVLMQGSHQPAFFISWRSQRDVVNSLGWKSSLMK